MNLTRIVRRFGTTEKTTEDRMVYDSGYGEYKNWVVKEETGRDALSVIIACAPCALLKGQKFPNKAKCDADKCKKCGACLKPGCPAVTKTEEGYIKIDETMCNGCGLCTKLCKFDALKLYEA